MDIAGLVIKGKTAISWFVGNAAFASTASGCVGARFSGGLCSGARSNFFRHVGYRADTHGAADRWVETGPLCTGTGGIMTAWINSNLGGARERVRPVHILPLGRRVDLRRWRDCRVDFQCNDFWDGYDGQRRARPRAASILGRTYWALHLGPAQPDPTTCPMIVCGSAPTGHCRRKRGSSAPTGLIAKQMTKCTVPADFKRNTDMAGLVSNAASWASLLATVGC